MGCGESKSKKMRPCLRVPGQMSQSDSPLFLLKSSGRRGAGSIRAAGKAYTTDF
jgi:hypothetical protein